MLDRPIYESSHSAISSLESASGVTLSESQDGAITSASGQAHVLANLSARQAKGLGLLTSGTFGPPGITSSSSGVLALSLASRLQKSLACRGSTLYRLTWKQRVTPSQRSIYALRAWEPRTDDKEYFSWATPNAKETDEIPASRLRRDRRHKAAGMKKGVGGLSLSSQALQAVREGFGKVRTGSSELLIAIPDGALLSPAHSLWLQGLPDAWLFCGERAIRLTLRLRSRSSELTGTREVVSESLYDNKLQKLWSAVRP